MRDLFQPAGTSGSTSMAGTVYVCMTVVVGQFLISVVMLAAPNNLYTMSETQPISSCCIHQTHLINSWLIVDIPSASHHTVRYRTQPASKHMCFECKQFPALDPPFARSTHISGRKKNLIVAGPKIVLVGKPPLGLCASGPPYADLGSSTGPLLVPL